jgi:ribokinase
VKAGGGGIAPESPVAPRVEVGGSGITAASPAAPLVVVAGSCIVDYSVTVPRLPRPGETVIAGSVNRSLGGKGANQATALRRLGCAVAFISCVGEDEAGEAFLRLFAQEGIDAAFVHRDPAAPTGMAFPMVLEGGGNAIVAAPSASMLLPVATVEAAAAKLRAAAALLVQLEIPLAAVAALLHLARAAGVPAFLNPAPAVPGAAELLQAADVAIPNHLEAEALTGLAVNSPQDALRAARKLRDLGPEVAIVTLGEGGAVLSAPGTERHLPAYAIAAVDSTGAGDAFCAGLVDARCRGAGWLEALQFAAACGALACRGPGAIPWLPAAVEVRDFMAGRPELP